MLGGYSNGGWFVILLLVMMAPASLVVRLLLDVEKRLDTTGVFLIPLIGTGPLWLVLFMGGRGNTEYINVLVTCGLVWGVLWYVSRSRFAS
jgi:uncharacterized membrane protein YhaH (DUF805 family)